MDFELKDTIFERVSRIVNSELSHDEMLGQILGLTAKISNCDACLIYLMEFATGEFVLRASQLPRSHDLSIMRIKFGEGITGYVAEKQELVALRSGAPNDPRFRSIPGLIEDTYEALLSVPLVHRGRSIGVINVHHREPHEHTADEIACTVFIGEQMGAAIAKDLLEEENMRLAERDRRLEQDRVRLENEVARRTAELKSSEERLRLITETISEVFWMADDRLSYFLYLSPAFERVWGRTRESCYAARESLLDLIHPDDLKAAADYVNLKLGQDEVLDHEYRIIQPDGTVKWIWNRGFPVPYGHDGLGRYVGVAVDITERKELESRLGQAQKLESVGQLAAGVAHEINTPIQYIGDNARFLEEAFSQLICAKRPLEPGIAGQETFEFDYLRSEVPRAIRELQDGVEHVARIVRALKEFSHPGPLEKSPVDINHGIESTVQISRNEWKYVADVTTDLDPELPLVPGLAGELNQVFLNLIVNAAHAIEEQNKGSNIKGSIQIATRRQGEFVEIRVSDTGCGIPKSVQSKVFDPFFTTKPVGKGTGQGLAIVHSVIVQKHQGSIWLESEPGVGTTFVFQLPLELKPGDARASQPCNV